MFAAAAGELVTAVTITDVLQAAVQMYCTVMHYSDAGLNQAGPSNGTFQNQNYLASPSLDWRFMIYSDCDSFIMKI